MSTEIVVITGAAGTIGRAIVPALRKPGRELRLLDLRRPADASPADRWIIGSVTDHAVLRAAMDGAHAVVHLAGFAQERPWDDILRVNIDGAQAVLATAHAAGVAAVFLASSIHAVGYATPAEAGTTALLPPRPDTYYGVSKAATEALGSLFADRFGMSVTSARICTFGEDPGAGRSIAQWLSPADATRLVEAAIARRDGGHRIVWGVSRNGPAWFPLEPGEQIGYRPQDDAVARTILRDGIAPPHPEDVRPLAASFIDAAHPLGEAW